MTIRNIVKIDEEKCNGCGKCAQACAEGAIQIIDGKAKLISETYCDGLGACLGDCPVDAITVEQRESEPFDPKAVEEHLAKRALKASAEPMPPMPCQCPGTMTQRLKADNKPTLEHAHEQHDVETPSELGNWPVQLRLIPPQAPYLNGSKILLAADCAPFAYADFHRRFLSDRVLIIACPKLDDFETLAQKLAQILAFNDIQSIEVAYMEVPCCYGLIKMITQALEMSGKNIPLKATKIGIRGKIVQSDELQQKVG